MKLPCPNSEQCLLDHHAQGHARPSVSCYQAVLAGPDARCDYAKETDKAILASGAYVDEPCVPGCGGPHWRAKP